MTERAEEYERTTGFAEIALGQMKALRHANNPRNYEIWYTYATGYHPALNAQINAMLKAIAAGTSPTTAPLPPLKLAIEGRAADGWYTLSRLTVR